LSVDALNPTEALQLGTVMRDRRRARRVGPPPSVWLSKTLGEWISASAASVLVLEGSFIRREDSRDFALDLIHLARSVQMPTVWVLGANMPSLSAVDAIQSLIQQILDLHGERFTDSALSEQDFRSCNTTTDWIDLFITVVNHVPRCLLVVEAQDKSLQTVQMMEQFWGEVVKRRVKTVLKILLLTYQGTKTAVAFPSSAEEYGSFHMNIKGNRRPGTARSYSTPLRGSQRGSQTAGTLRFKPLVMKLLGG